MNGRANPTVFCRNGSTMRDTARSGCIFLGMICAIRSARAVGVETEEERWHMNTVSAVAAARGRVPATLLNS